MDARAGWALIVDGDQETLPIYRSVLADLGFASEFCGGAAQGTLALARREYRLILLNPRTLGRGAVEMLIQANRLPYPPAVVVVGDAIAATTAANAPGSEPLDADALRASIAAAEPGRGAQPSMDASRTAGAPDRLALCQQLARIAKAALLADRASLMLWEGGDDRVMVAASVGAPFAIPGDTSSPLHDSVSGWVIGHAEPLLVSQGGDLPFDRQGIWRSDRWRAGMCVPLIHGGRVRGALTATRRDGSPAFTEADLEHLLPIANLAAAALESAELQSIARATSRYHTLFQRTGDAIFLIDAGTLAIVDANPAAERLSGYSRAELSAIPPSQLLAPGGLVRGGASLADVLARTTTEYQGYIRARGGSSSPVSISSSEIVIDAKRHILLNARDVAEQRQQASRQAQTEKLAGMTRLTAAIAHEINNPLQALHNTLHLLLNRSFTDDKRERLLGMAHGEVSRLTDLVRRMLELHRPAQGDMRPVSVHGLLENALSAMASQIQERRVEVERDWSDRLPWVIGIGGHLRQVFQDLATNAIEAMPEGGRLVIRTRVEEDQGVARVLVEFADNGPGLPDGEAQLIFEPFYSTKRGNSGLGLAISYSIVERHGGTLSVIGGPGGTTFRVALPAASRL